jgi:hypothetical protein
MFTTQMLDGKMLVGRGTLYGKVLMQYPDTTLTGTNIKNFEIDLAGDVSSGSSSITVSDASLFHAGDNVLVIQMQIYRYITTPASPDMAVANANLGKYELLKIDHIVGNTVYFKTSLVNSYLSDSGAYTVTNTRAQMVYVPSYGILTFNTGSTLKCNPWNGLKGGIVAVKAHSIAGTGTVTASALGYRKASEQSTYVDIQDAEGWMGDWNTTSWISSLQGSGTQCFAMSNNGACPGGGGGHITNGTLSHKVYLGNPYDFAGGKAFGSTNLLSNLTFGGAGGAGGSHNGTRYFFSAGNGGGIVLLITDSISSTIAISSNGENGYYNIDTGYYYGGGGAGGSILVKGSHHTGTATVTAGLPFGANGIYMNNY